MMLAVGFSINAYKVEVRTTLFYLFLFFGPYFSECFYHKRVLDFIKSSFCIKWNHHVVFPFCPLIWCVYILYVWYTHCVCVWYTTLVDFLMLNYPCIPEINTTWSWYIIPLLCCCSLLGICWGTFSSIFIRIYGVGKFVLFCFVLPI